jgi:catechol 2,3-dioxygenase-like lactoylglutathione lyase family enzyme
MMAENTLALGRLDICLNVKDAKRSVDFYKALGFEQVEGDVERGYAILVNSESRIALYQGEISCNMLNFRGGDVFALAAELKKRGLALLSDAEVEKDGTAGAMLKDPDGNMIYLNT